MIRVQRRRRREQKTDYLHRLKILKGKKPRVVFRKTNKYIIAQYITSREAQDKVEISMDSRALKEYGWPEEFSGSLKSLPASYLTGYLIGKEIKEKKLEDPVIDIGLIRAVHKTRVFAFIKGIIDSGIKIACAKEAFPDEKRIEGKNLKKDFTKIFNEIKNKISKK